MEAIAERLEASKVSVEFHTNKVMRLTKQLAKAHAATVAAADTLKSIDLTNYEAMLTALHALSKAVKAQLGECVDFRTASHYLEGAKLDVGEWQNEIAKRAAAPAAAQ